MIDERIKQLRENAGLTQAALAKKLNITRASVNAWEMGISIPSTRYVVELADIFGVSTDYLLGRNTKAAINLDGLDESDIQLLHSIVKHLQNKRTS